MRRWADMSPGERRQVIHTVSEPRMRRLSAAQWNALSHHEQVIWKAKWDRYRENRLARYTATMDEINKVLFAVFVITGTALIVYIICQSFFP